MAMHNRDIAALFSQTADLLEIKGDNPFRIRAYRNAARAVESLPGNASDMVAGGDVLSEYPDIGKDLEGKIKDIIATGNFKVLEDLKKLVPEELSELMAISGLGAKRVAALYHELNISSLEKLKKALDSGQVRELEGFGKKTEQNIRDQIERLEKQPAGRKMLAYAEEIALPLIEYLKQGEGVKRIDIAGSFRRRKETVRDIDILAACKKGSDIMDRFTAYEDVQKVVSKGTTRSTVLLRSDFQVDIRVVQEVSYGAAMVYFTGSKEHNVAIRKIGVRKKLKINEYGVFKNNKRVAGKSEEDVYKKIGLSYIEPELRENRGEIDAAAEGNLPELITSDDIRGDLHMHTKYTDGHNTIEDMARATADMGYEYIAITDHSRHVSMVGGLTAKELRKQIREIDKVNEKIPGITILKGSEVDILDDGSLDLPDDVLKELDLRVCSVHYKFNLSKEQQTERVIRAMDNPYFNILAHPSGRLINERAPYDIDMDRIIKAAAERGCMLELNSHPDRLDLNDIYCKSAKENGVKVVISTDSHQDQHLKYIKYGIGQARRGWLEKKDVANTRTLRQLKKLLKRE